jgi:hypothetical protein
MSLAATREAIMRALAAARDGKDELYDHGDKYEISEEELAFDAKTTELVLQALTDAKKDHREAVRAERQEQRRAPHRRTKPDPKKVGKMTKQEEKEHTDLTNARLFRRFRNVKAIQVVEENENENDTDTEDARGGRK